MDRGNVVGAAPLPSEIYIEAGAHQFGASLAGYKPATKRVELAKASVTRIELVLVPKGEAKQGTSGPSAAVLGVGFGLGGAALVAGGVLFGLGAGKQSQANDANAAFGSKPCAADPAACDNIDSPRRSHDTLWNAGLWSMV